MSDNGGIKRADPRTGSSGGARGVVDTDNASEMETIGDVSGDGFPTQLVVTIAAAVIALIGLAFLVLTAGK